MFSNHRACGKLRMLSQPSQQEPSVERSWPRRHTWMRHLRNGVNPSEFHRRPPSFWENCINRNTAGLVTKGTETGQNEKRHQGLQNSTGKKQTEKMFPLQTSVTFHDSEVGTIVQRVEPRAMETYFQALTTNEGTSNILPVELQNCYGRWLLCISHFPLFGQKYLYQLPYACTTIVFWVYVKHMTLSFFRRFADWDGPYSEELYLKNYTQGDSSTLEADLDEKVMNFVTHTHCPDNFPTLYSHLLKHLLSTYCLPFTELQAGYFKVKQDIIIYLKSDRKDIEVNANSIMGK